MAEKKETKKVVKKETKKVFTLDERRKELQKVSLLVKSNEEKDTSKVKKVKKEIAKLLTNLNKK